MSWDLPTGEEKAELDARNEKARLLEWEKAESGMQSPQQSQQREALAELKQLTIDAALNVDPETASMLRDEALKATLACKEAGCTVRQVQDSLNYWHKLLEAGHFRREPGK